jgi:hypothetical protein
VIRVMGDGSDQGNGLTLDGSQTLD